MHNISQTGYAGKLWVLLVSVMTLLVACREKQHGSPQGYDFRKTQRRDFTKQLNEISGLFFDRDSQALLAISDSRDNIYLVDLKNQKLRDYAKNFHKQGDFEDIVK